MPAHGRPVPPLALRDVTVLAQAADRTDDVPVPSGTTQTEGSVRLVGLPEPEGEVGPELGELCDLRTR